MKTASACFSLLALCGVASAQDPNLADVQGNLFPSSTVALPIDNPSYSLPMSVAPDGSIYAALDASLPSGVYYFQVLDLYLSNLSPLPLGDRMFQVTNNGLGALSIARLGATPGLPAVGAGLGGIGDSLPIFPFASPAPIPTRPDLLCTQKMILFELLPSGASQIVRIGYFRVGDGSPGSVSGVVFTDDDRDGERDSGEVGVPGCIVKLVSNNPANPGQVMATTTTNGLGEYLFSNVAVDDCSVVLELDTGIFQATTPLDVVLANCGCGSRVVDFGKVALETSCEGRTPGFWRNNNGVALINGGSFWDELRGLNLVNAQGVAFDPTGNTNQWRSYLQGANATNMAYMLSAHLAAMQLNVLSEGVDLGCQVQSAFGAVTIGDLLFMANDALGADGYTPVGDANRAYQEQLKNALDAANNNSNWL
jgi:hypothetical protein